MHAQLSKLCDVIDRLVRVVVRIDERRRADETGWARRRCEGCGIVTVEKECPMCGTATVWP
jgi:rRNA maturation endonuclease Nob1